MRMLFLILSPGLIVSFAQGQVSAPDEWPQLKPYNRGAKWPAPRLSASNYRKWIDELWPSKEELKWRKIRWHRELSEAAKEARRLKRPILLWTMNGHPCGET